MSESVNLSTESTPALTPTPASTQTPSPPACDCHFHVFDAFGALRHSPDARYEPHYSATLDAWEACAQSAGVRRGVVVQPSFLGADNQQLLQTVAQRPQTLRGVAVAAANVTARELQALHSAGVRGIRLNLMGAEDDVGALRALPASWWSALMAADMHLELHADIGRINALLPRVSNELTVVLDHFAKPFRVDLQDDTVRAVSHRSRSGGVTYVTLSGAYRQAEATRALCGELASLWLGELGADQLLWGSDWPCTNFESQANYPALLDAMRAWLPRASDWPNAIAFNAQRLYWR